MLSAVYYVVLLLRVVSIKAVFVYPQVLRGVSEMFGTRPCRQAGRHAGLEACRPGGTLKLTFGTTLQSSFPAHDFQAKGHVKCLCTMMCHLYRARNEIWHCDLHHCDRHEWRIQMMSILPQVDFDPNHGLVPLIEFDFWQ